mmetsp:Transcript_8200/g.25756  ORF Transcript_8200/g.25756 Transcript_8200/m.25756 type:complete len:148 (-) Transcript_8200:13-456(-)
MGATFSKPVIAALLFLYPAYATFKALERSNDRQRVAQMAAIWCSIATVAGTNGILSPFLNSIPGWSLVKLLVAVWLVRNDFEGARQLYGSVLRSPLLKNERYLDAALDNGKRELVRVQTIAHRHAAAFLREVAARFEAWKRQTRTRS